ncbi:MAG: SprT-like domain-containing protein [Bacteroidetes bacterium]|nr:SprT-like domain-containing protein [Bacteroidota bacterium]
MDQLKRNSNILAKYIPAPAVPLLAEWIWHFNFKLKIKKSRATRFGDYHPPLPGKNHTITVNNDLNQFAFLLTLVHEIAHLLCFERFGNRVKPHGEEWKECFKELMRPFMRLDIFPDDVRAAVIAYMRDPRASSCTDAHLLRTLRKFDKPSDFIHLETLPAGSEFIYGEKVFLKGKKIRTRYRCSLKNTSHIYFFSALAEVKRGINYE